MKSVTNRTNEKYKSNKIPERNIDQNYSHKFSRQVVMPFCSLRSMVGGAFHRGGSMPLVLPPLACTFIHCHIGATKSHARCQLPLFSIAMLVFLHGLSRVLSVELTVGGPLESRSIKHEVGLPLNHSALRASIGRRCTRRQHPLQQAASDAAHNLDNNRFRKDFMQPTVREQRPSMSSNV